MKQSPIPGTRLPEGDKVDLVVSAGVQKVIVPTLVGLPLPQAQEELKKAGLRLNSKVLTREDPGAEPNEVLASNPVGGDEVDARTVVQLTVAAGEITVPNVVGLTLDQAQEKLELSGFRHRLGTDEFSDKPVGTVIKQVPEADGKRKLPRNSPIVLIRSSGASPTPTPPPTTPPAETTTPPAETTTPPAETTPPATDTPPATETPPAG
jgi:serine/threonine-protein kinase